MNYFHTPALLKETIDALNVKIGKKYIDATVGGGGHAVEILKHGGVVLGIDVDRDAIEYTARRWKVESRKWKLSKEKLFLVRGNFRDIKEIALSNKFDKPAGVLFDLGMSSHQLEKEGRGFSFQKDAPLDMRMDQDLQVKAKDLINGLTKGELYDLFTKLGQEELALAISDHIIRARKIRPIENTLQLARLVAGVYRDRRKRTSIHPATKVFQALRIAVNDELNNLSVALPAAVELLEEGGRLVVISFHSLEDRIVKNKFKRWAGEEKGMLLTKKPIKADEDEIMLNPKVRSAKMRVMEKA